MTSGIIYCRLAGELDIFRFFLRTRPYGEENTLGAAKAEKQKTLQGSNRRISKECRWQGRNASEVRANIEKPSGILSRFARNRFVDQRDGAGLARVDVEER